MHQLTAWRRHFSSGPRAVFFIVMMASLLATPFFAHRADAAGADALAEKVLDRLGGREAWAGLRNTINGSQQNRAGEPTVVYAVITMDFERPRFRIETTAQDLHLVRVIDGDNSWRLRRNGNIEDVPADRFAEEMQWYGAHLYRTLHRVAARDPALSAGLGTDSRLEISADGKRILWLKLDSKGEPYAFGFYDDDGPCLTRDETFSDEFAAASLSNLEPADYLYPDTMVWFVFGELDESSAVGQGITFFDRLVEAGSPLVELTIAPRTPHATPSTRQGARAIHDALLDSCRPWD